MDTVSNTLKHNQLIIDTCFKYIKFDDFSNEDRNKIIKSEHLLQEQIKKYKEEYEAMMEKSKQSMKKVEEIGEMAAKFEKECKENKSKLDESFAKFKNATNKIFEKEGIIEDKIMNWFNSFDKEDPNFNVHFHCINILCDRLELYGEPEYFDYLCNSAKNWVEDKTMPEYLSFCELTNDDTIEEVKRRGIKLIRKFDFASLRRFTTICVSNGMSNDVINFTK